LNRYARRSLSFLYSGPYASFRRFHINNGTIFETGANAKTGPDELNPKARILLTDQANDLTGSNVQNGDCFTLRIYPSLKHGD
jgi:hypothetical protein